MPALARGQENTEGIVNWFITVNGVLTDAYLLQYRIFDISAGLPGTQIFPTVPGTWEDVTSNTGHFSPGSYYAWDHNTSKGWMPSLTEAIGTHRIEWKWKITGAAPEQMGQEDFEVLVQSGGSSADTYITIADVRAEGITVDMASDVKVLSYIQTWQAFLERATRQWFVPKTIVLSIDGNESNIIHFSVPIIQIDYVKINNSIDALDVGLYRAYTSRDYPDDRHNPRIALVNETEYRDIYTMPILNGPLRFRKGYKNQEIKGIFGYTEADGSVPAMIKRAALLLTVEKLTTPIYTTAPSGTGLPPIISSILEEETDGHRIKYADPMPTDNNLRPGLSGITGNQEILDIIKLYRAPLGVAAPSHPSLA
jgi:hypothetical protein